MRFEDENKRAIGPIFRSLACQLANSTPSYAHQLRQLGTAGANIKDQDYRSIWHLLYKQSLLSLGITKLIHWVLDGLDEADDLEALINTLAEFRSSNIPIRILVVSRPTHDIAMSFQRLEEQLPQFGSISVEGHKDDFHRYINREMGLDGDKSYREGIVSEVLLRAQGNFLWVHLAVQKINKCHTKVDVNNALKHLPPGMEALYGRMASSVRTDPDSADPTIGERILEWATFVQRPLTVDELSDALDNNGLLELHRTIGDLCGGFLVVDHEGRVSLIHETAREYISRKHHQPSHFILDPKATHDKLFKRCVMRLMGKSLRIQINQDRRPALLDYATSGWIFHLSQGSITNQDILKSLTKFLQGPSILTWIYATAKERKLRLPVEVSSCLRDVAKQLKHNESPLNGETIDLLTRWAADFVKIVGKFGTALLQRPDSIYQLIPPFCPDSSAIYQQFGHKEMNVSGVG
ncbi:hypothetical protein IMZ48_32195 [Candidatus Bathyarchaeota archaeon]|nr:hypothetical protein [Candidatus Bathyarchaeota archaeon]